MEVQLDMYINNSNTYVADSSPTFKFKILLLIVKKLSYLVVFEPRDPNQNKSNVGGQ